MPTTTVSEAQSGGAVELKRGDELIVSLTENPTTGFRWAVVADAGLVFRLQAPTFNQAARRRREPEGGGSFASM